MEYGPNSFMTLATFKADQPRSKEMQLPIAPDGVIIPGLCIDNLIRKGRFFGPAHQQCGIAAGAREQLE